MPFEQKHCSKQCQKKKKIKKERKENIEEKLSKLFSKLKNEWPVVGIVWAFKDSPLGWDGSYK